MVTNKQVRKLFEDLRLGLTLKAAALRAGMDEKTARRYRTEWKMPNELRKEHNWRTRENPFASVWGEVEGWLKANERIEAKTIFEWLMEQHPSCFSSGQLRTLQRQIRQWRALEGAGKEAFFEQVHHPGRLSQSDFTDMTELGITIEGKLFKHLLFHFVLTYSNWEDISLCYSESFESLSAGLQNAFWRLGAIALRHQTDRMTAAVNKDNNPQRFTAAYQALSRHYGFEPQTIQAGKGSQNGDAEQSHNRLKKAVEQALILRGSRDFAEVKKYWEFLEGIRDRRNAPRLSRLEEEKKLLKPLPAYRLEDCKRFCVRVSKFSTILVQHNLYSVHSRLIGEWIEIRSYADRLEVWFAQRCVDRLPRLHGEKQHQIQYRHIIDWLVRKPGAFENYRYQADLFPTTQFRLAYDLLKDRHPSSASKEYLQILNLAAKESEEKVDQALRLLLANEELPSLDLVKERIAVPLPVNAEITVAAPDLSIYDNLLEHKEFDYEQQFETYAY